MTDRPKYLLLTGNKQRTPLSDQHFNAQNGLSKWTCLFFSIYTNSKAQRMHEYQFIDVSSNFHRYFVLAFISADLFSPFGYSI